MTFCSWQRISAGRIVGPAVLLVLCCALFGAGSTTAQENNPGPDEMIRQAISRGARRVVIPPGTYRLSRGIRLANAHDMEIVGAGVTLVFTTLSRAFDFDHCTNLTFRSFTIDFDPLPFTQGKVIRAGPDGNWVDVKLDAGYPRVAYSRINVCDPKTRTRKRGMPFLWGTQAAIVGNDVVRLTRPGLARTAMPGDPVSMSGGPAPGAPPHAIALGHCSGMTFTDVTVCTAPGMGILESDGDGRTRYVNVRVIPGPPPAGATEDRLLSTTWDAFQCKSSRVGPTLEECEVRDAGDDSWSVQSSDFVMLAVSGREAVIGYRDEYCDGPQVGDRLRASLDGPEAQIISRRHCDLATAGLPADVVEHLRTAKPWSFWHLSRKMMSVTLDRDAPFVAGESVYCPDRQCNGFVVRHCRFQSPGRGALVKASQGVIEDNDFVDCHSAVTIDAELPAGAASGIRDVVIRNNRITGTGYFCPSFESSQAGAISVTGGTQPVRDVRIEQNTFDDINGVNICLLGVVGATIRDNHFRHVHQTAPQNTGGRVGVDQRSVIFAARCSELHLEENTVDRLGPFTSALVGGDALGPGDHAEQGITVLPHR
jgi:hypothetical protein